VSRFPERVPYADLFRRGTGSHCAEPPTHDFSGGSQRWHPDLPLQVQHLKKRRGYGPDDKPNRAIPIATNPKAEGSGAAIPTKLPPVIDRWRTLLPEEKSSPTKVSSEASPRIATEPPVAGNAVSA
jgi:hypothetical protein